MLYQTRVINQEGIKGNLTFSDNQPLRTQHPLTQDPGYNPEQLIASAWATCLNATIQTVLAERKQTHRSNVSITVTLCQETIEVGYYFQVEAQAGIEDMTIEEATTVIHQAHGRCPVSKLLAGAKPLTLDIVNFENCHS